MKKILALVCVAGLSAPAFAATNMATLNARLEAARTTIQQIEATPDHSIPMQITENATCVGVVPGLIKGAFILGGERGQGVVTCRTGHGWSAPVFIQMTGASWGLQIGGQSTDLVLVAVNQKGFQDLINSKFKIGAGASAAAGPVGRNAQMATNWKMQSELLTWSRSKGLFAGIDLNGTVVAQNQDADNLFYHSHHTPDQILKGEVLPPASARPFLRTVAQYFRTSTAH
uniref:Ysc84 actin-binding domain-containing protein n=1 Tax=Acidobacterium capsulatum TaxID=33075 RepID=A0A7V5CTA3_9BACT